MAMMRHCRQCRADAVGLLGEDRGAEFTLDKITGREIDHAAAMARRQEVKATLLAQMQARRAPVQTPAQAIVFMPKPTLRPVLMALAAKHGVVGEHFGHAKEFLLYEASTTGVRFVGHRKVDLYCSGEESCDEGESKLDKTLRVLAGCEVVLCSRIGYEPWRKLEAAGIRPNAEHAMEEIEAAVAAVYEEMRTAGELKQTPAGKKAA